MEILHRVVMIIALISGVGLITAVTMQTTKNQGFSAAMGGGDSARFRKGSREEMLDRATKIAAIIWICACALNFVFWHQAAK